MILVHRGFQLYPVERDYQNNNWCSVSFKKSRKPPGTRLKDSVVLKYLRYSLLCGKFSNSTNIENKLFLITPLLRKRNHHVSPWGILCCKTNTWTPDPDLLRLCCHISSFTLFLSSTYPSLSLLKLHLFFHVALNIAIAQYAY